MQIKLQAKRAVTVFADCVLTRLVLFRRLSNDGKNYVKQFVI